MRFLSLQGSIHLWDEGATKIKMVSSTAVLDIKVAFLWIKYCMNMTKIRYKRILYS